MKKQKSKIKRSISIDKKLNNLMNDTISNKSKYIEWLIYQDLKKILSEDKIKNIML